MNLPATPISAARRSEIPLSSVLRPPLAKPATSPLWANSQRPDWKGGVLDSSVGEGAVAVRFVHERMSLLEGASCRSRVAPSTRAASSSSRGI